MIGLALLDENPFFWFGPFFLRLWIALGGLVESQLQHREAEKPLLSSCCLHWLHTGWVDCGRVEVVVVDVPKVDEPLLGRLEILNRNRGLHSSTGIASAPHYIVVEQQFTALLGCGEEKVEGGGGDYV